MAQENHPAAESSTGAPRKKRSAAEWTIATLLSVAIVGGLAIETSSRLGYRATMAKMQNRVPTPGHPVPEPLNADEADKLVSGWPIKSVEKLRDGASVQYLWRSLFHNLVITLKVASDGSVVALESNLPELPDVEPPTGPSPTAPIQYARGLRTDAAPGFALDLNNFTPLQPGGGHGHLSREVVRQALLLAARDELGLATRDKALNEPIPEEKSSGLPVMNLLNWEIENRHVRVALVAPTVQGTAPPVNLEFDVPPGGWLEGLAIVTESLSRSEFVAVLKKVGFTGEGRRFLPEGAVGDSILQDSAHLDVLSQFAAVRALHNEIAVLGESPDRLAALSRGYASLGALTEYLWSPAYKVFAARGLLYAERLMSKSSNRPLSLQNRAYVRALTGLHGSALADLAAAAALPATGEAPAWVAPIEAFCRSDARGLGEMIDRGTESTLAGYLNLLLAAASGTSQIRLDAARRMLALAPDCMPAYEVLLIAPELDVLRQVAVSAPDNFSLSLRLRLESTDYISDVARRLISDRSQNPAVDMKTRADLVQLLTEAGRLGKDAGEPSLAALATIIRETGFVHAWRLVSFLASSPRADVAETMARIRPIVKGHPFEAFIDVQLGDYDAAVKTWRSVLQRPVEPAVGATMHVDRGFSPADIGNYGAEKMTETFARQCDPIYPDLVRILRLGASAKLKADLSATLRDISPLSPAGIAAAITHDWERASESAGEWERRFGDSPDVIQALGDRYMALDRFEDAERCLKRRIELLQDHEAYQALASFYWNRGNERLWEETLLASLKIPSFGLADVNSRVSLAYYYMRRKEWEKARPHVEAAARSYSSASYMCAADFYERTGDWVRAESFERSSAERFEHGIHKWYLWCRRTGHGDVDAARARMQDELEYLSNVGGIEASGTAAMLYTLEDKPELSLNVLKEGLAYKSGPYYCLLAALRADESGRTKLRDEFLKKAVSVTDWRFTEFKNWVRAFVAAPELALDRKLLDWTIREGSIGAGNATAKFYLAGSFLAAHGREQEAHDYLEQAATSVAFRQDDSVMAAYALRQRGVPIGELRETEFDPQTTEWLKRLKVARVLADGAKWEESVGKCTKLIDEAPDFPDAFEQRSYGYLEMDRFEPALADINRAIDLLPTCARFHYWRAKIEDRMGRHQEAIDDYQAALKLVPDYARAHHELTFLYAACLDPKFRDARKAREHAQRSFDSGEIVQFVSFAALAVAAAEAGDFPKAVQAQSQAINVAPQNERRSLEERRRLFERREPYHRLPEWWKEQ